MSVWWREKKKTLDRTNERTGSLRTNWFQMANVSRTLSVKEEEVGEEAPKCD